MGRNLNNVFIFNFETVPYTGIYYGEREKHDREHDQSKCMSLIKSIKILPL